jgi:hypothetical protein
MFESQIIPELQEFRQKLTQRNYPAIFTVDFYLLKN